ncbi:MAG: universal stress protein [Mycobacterium sp.]
MYGPTPPLGIVVGVDGSAPARVAVRWAAYEALMRNVPLTLVHVIPAIPTGAIDFLSVDTRNQLQQQRDSTAREVIADTIDMVKGSPEGDDLDVRGEVVHGHPVPTLVDMSKEARLVAVGPRGLGPLGESMLGSVSAELLRRAHCPVAVVRDHLSKAAQPNALPVIVGIDGSPTSELATEIAFDEAASRGVDLVALHAWSDVRILPGPAKYWDQLHTCAEEVLAERLAGFQERYPDVAVRRLLVLEHPARHLLHEAEAAQLLVVGSHGRGGFAGMLLGSVSTTVVHAARTPVIVARQR